MTMDILMLTGKLIKKYLLFFIFFSGFIGSENFIPNSSFEVGSLERRWAGRWEKNFGWHGNACAKIPPPDSNEKYVRQDFRGISSAYFVVPEPNQPYVVSVYLKSTGKIKAGIRISKNSKENENLTVAQKIVSVDKNWKRYSLKINSLPPSYGNTYSVYIFKLNDRVPETLYVDAVQMEKGIEPTPYKPKEDVCFGLITEKPRNIFSPEEKVKINILAYNSEKEEKIKKLEFIVKNYWNKEVFSKNISLKVPPENTIIFPLKFNLKEIGSFRAELYEKNGLIQDELIFSILPEIPLKERDLGYAYGAKPDDPEWSVIPRFIGLRYGGRWVGGASWNVVQPDGPDDWHWEIMDRIVADAEKGKIKLVDVYLGTGMDWKTRKPLPRWAFEKKDKKRPHPYGFDLDDWERYVYQVVKRYKGRVNSWGIWNEPYFDKPEAYLELMKVTYSVIKKANPEAEVCGVDSTPNTISWTEKFLKMGGIKYIDVFTSHAYEAEGGYFTESLRRLFKWASYDGKKRPVYNTETQTYPASTSTFYSHLFPAMNETYLGKGLTAEEGAQRWTKLYITNKAVGIKIILPHLMFTDRFSPTILRDYGGFEHDLSLSPKLTAWAAAGRIIGKAEGLGEVYISPLLRVMLFSKEKDSIAVIWTRQYESPPMMTDVPNEETFRLPQSSLTERGIVRIIHQVKRGKLVLDKKIPVEVFDFMRNLITPEGKSTYPVGIEPVYLIAKNTPPDTLVNFLKKSKLEGFGSFKANASIATGPEGKAGIVISIKSLLPIEQSLKIKVENQEELFEHKEMVKKIFSQTEYEFTIPFKNPENLPEKIGPFIVFVESNGEKQKIEIPTLFITKSYKAKRPVLIDGKLDEWGSDVSLILNSKQKIILKNQQELWKGPHDSSLIMRSSWDDKFLYFAYEVKDNSIRREGSASTMYKGDCIEMFFDVDVMGDIEEGSMNKDDFRINVGPIDNNFSDADASMREKGVKVAGKKTVDGYVIEVGIPWELFLQYGAGPYPETVIGFTVNFYDRDQEDEKWAHAVFVWAEKDKWWTSTGKWGRLILVSENEKMDN